MFAVPGWSLEPALLKKQAVASADLPESSKSAKKRKRDPNREEGTLVTNNNVAALWKQHVEGIPDTITSTKPTNNVEDRLSPSIIKDNLPFIATGSNADAIRKGDLAKRHEKPSKKQKKQKAPQADIEPSVVSDTFESTETPAINEPVHKERSGLKKDRKSTAHPPVEPKDPPVTKLTPLQTAMRKKLLGARFRHLNESLYTSPSADSWKLFFADPSSFEDYHTGFRQQVSAWPENPVNGFLEDIKQRGKVLVQPKKEDRGRNHPRPLPRSQGICRVADLGCGDAALAKQIWQLTKKLKVDITSYDLSGTDEFIIKADIANLPAESGRFDVAIFCLALMGTNWIDFIEEAFRVLHWKGELWVAEIKSRFGRPKQKKVVDHSVGKQKKPNKADVQKQRRVEESANDDQIVAALDGPDTPQTTTDVSAFVEVLKSRGFALQDEHSTDLSNKMFVKLRFVKALDPTKGKNFKKEVIEDSARTNMPKKPKYLDGREDNVDESTILKPCLYKIR